MESLLVNVSKYASSHQTSPIENFITEAFAWLLKYDDEVRDSMDTLLKSKAELKNLAYQPLCQSDDIETQVNFGGKYPDLLWNSTDNRFSVIFEHKIWSELHPQQLDNYRKYAQAHLNRDFIIVLITAHVGQHRQSPDIALCWYEIAKIIKSLEDGDDRSTWLRIEFVKLLQSNGLVNTTPINPLAISYYNDVKNIDSKLYEIVQRSVQSSWPIYESELSFHKSARHRNARGRNDSWGRIGLEFSSLNADNDESSWNPGLFCGFLIDGADHVAKDLLKNGPIAVFMISVNKNTQPKLKRNGAYDRLVAELSLTLPTGWLVSDRTVRGHKFNPWHPLIIYRSLADFMSGADTLEQQSATYFEQMSELQSVFTASTSFVDFCDELRR